MNSPPLTRLDDPVVVFDGVCNLCAGSIQFVLKHEADHTLRFTPLQSNAGAQILRQFGFDPAPGGTGGTGGPGGPGGVQTFVLVADGKAYTRSEAAIRIARHLRCPWNLAALARLIPRPLRDWVYDGVAHNRYRWFGRKRVCMVPTAEISQRFFVE